MQRKKIISVIYAQKENVSLIYAQKGHVSLIYAQKENHFLNICKERKMFRLFMHRKNRFH